MAKPNLASSMYKSAAADDPADMGGVADDADSEAALDPEAQAASMIREAVEDGDDESLADALKSFFKLCSAQAESESPGPKGKPKLSTTFGKG